MTKKRKQRSLSSRGAPPSPPLTVPAAPSSSKNSSLRKLILLSIIIPNLLFLFSRFISISSAPSPKEAYKLSSHSSGHSLVATRSIQAGELLISESPLLILPQRFELSPSEVNQFIVGELEKAGKEKARKFRELSTLCGGREELGLESKVVKTNGIGVGNGKVGVLEKTSRINHSCRPNALFSWREEEGMLVVHALRHIEEREELTVPYISPLLPSSSRQLELSTRYNFTCTCPRCSSPHSSDLRLERYSDILSSISAFYPQKELNPQSAIVGLERMLTILEEEGVLMGRGGIARDCMRVAGEMGYEDGVREWGEKAKMWFGLELGEDSKEWKEIDFLEKNPTRMMGWGSRMNG